LSSSLQRHEVVHTGEKPMCVSNVENLQLLQQHSEDSH
jgi:hypothetical protein